MVANIKQLVRNTLNVSDITNLTGDKTVHFIHALKPIAPYIEYLIYDENGEEWAENKEIATSYYVQVDIFSKTDYTDLENKIKEKMESAGFDRTSSADLFEQDTQYFHKALRFLIEI